MSQKDKGAVLALIEVSRGDCHITNNVIGQNRAAKVETLRVGETSTLHRVHSIAEPHQLFPDLKKISDSITRVGKNGFWAECRSCSSCKFFAKNYSVVLSTKSIDSRRILYRILIQNQTKLKILERKLDEAGLNPVVLGTEYENQSLLTEREKEVVHMAYRHGYFDAQRGASMTEVAQMMKVSTPSLSDVLRRGTKKMVKTYVENKL